MLLYELCSGARPFDGATPLETLERVREAELPELDELGDPLATTLRRCLARAAEDRFGHMLELRDALASVRAGEGSLEELGEWVEAVASPRSLP